MDDSLEKIRNYCNGKIQPESEFFKYSDKNKPIRLFEYTKEEAERSESSDTGFEAIPSNKKLIVIKNDKNYGFAEGNNIGIRYSIKAISPDYVFLLNNDTVVDNEFLTRLVDVAESDSKIGVLGPKNYFYEKNGRTDILSFIGGSLNLKKYPGYFNMGENLPDAPKYSEGIIECDWITGAAMMLKIKEVPIKFLNSNLFFGCEDADLGIKLKRKGYKIVAVLNSKIWHKCGISRKKFSKKRLKRLFRDTKTNLTFLKMHNPHYYLFLPLYFIQLLYLILSNGFKRIFHQND
jgi:hypothetical protein